MFLQDITHFSHVHSKQSNILFITIGALILAGCSTVMSDNNNVSFVAEYAPFETGEDSNLFAMPIYTKNNNISGSRIRTNFIPGTIRQTAQSSIQKVPTQQESSTAQSEQKIKLASAQPALNPQQAKLFINRPAKIPEIKGAAEMKSVPVHVSSIAPKP